MEYNRKIRKKYGYYSDPFDRFGDDLCQLIISYLTINYKIYFKCVSKQCKSLIFDKQQKLSVNYFLIEKIMFNAIEIPKVLQNDEAFIGLLFKKFKFIKEIEINFCINDQIIEALIKKCLFLETLKRVINENKLIELIEYYCETLKLIDIKDSFNEENDRVSRFRNNLHKIEFIYFLGENYFPKLEQI